MCARVWSMSERLDVYLVRLGLASSRRRARELIAERRVRVNGRVLRKGEALEEGADVQVLDENRPPSILPNRELPLQVLFSDPAQIVIDKPGGMPCHPIRSAERETLMNAVVARFPETAEAGDKPLEG